MSPGFHAGVGGFLHRAGEINAGNHRKAANHRSLSRDRKPVLVIDRRIFDADGHVAVHQVGFVKIGERSFGAALRLLDHDCLERSHSPSLPSSPDALGRDCTVQKTTMPTEVAIRWNGPICATNAGQAGTGAVRTSGFSMIGRLMSADITPKNTESHHTGL